MDNTRKLSDAVIKKISAGSKAENDELRELLRSYGYNPVTADDIYDVLEDLGAVDNYETSHFTDDCGTTFSCATTTTRSSGATKILNRSPMPSSWMMYAAY